MAKIRSKVLRRLRGAEAETLRFRSVQQLSNDVAAWAPSLGARVGLVVGVPRSGSLAASLFALYAHKPLMDLPTFLAGQEAWQGLRLSGGDPRAGAVLVLDDTVNSGSEMARVKRAVASSSASRGREVLFGAVYASPRGVVHVDTYAELLPTPRAFEWNMLQNESVLGRCCMDIDGVLCPDPQPRQNDDAWRYRDFITHAPLVYRPRSPVHTLVTSRLEKYRGDTERWLQRNGVEYGELIMLDLPSAADRRQRRAHAPHKAAAYLASDNLVFIESSAEEGHLIHALTHRPVFITDTREFLGGATAVSAVDRRTAQMMSSRLSRRRS